MTSSVYVITGTPCTGKTSVAERLRDKGYEVINLFDFAREHDAIVEFDEDRESSVVDEDILYEQLDNFLEERDEPIIFEGHYGDLVPDQYVDTCFVLRAEVEDLRERLQERGYPKDKVEENIQAEIMRICWLDALEEFGDEKVRLVDQMPLDDIVGFINNVISSE